MNMKTIVLASFAMIALLSVACNCSGSGSGGSNSGSTSFHSLKIGDPPPTPIGQNVDLVALAARKGGRLDQACTLITDVEMALALGKTKEEIVLNNALSEDDPYHTACFYKWEDPELFNAGMFIQLMSNPYDDELPTFVSQFIEQKRSNGERDVDGIATVFKQLSGWGDDGSYDVETAKYFWRLGEEVAFSIAFNTTHTQEEQYQIATHLATMLTDNYLNN